MTNLVFNKPDGTVCCRTNNPAYLCEKCKARHRAATHNAALVMNGVGENCEMIPPTMADLLETSYVENAGEDYHPGVMEGNDPSDVLMIPPVINWAEAAGHRGTDEQYDENPRRSMRRDAIEIPGTMRYIFSDGKRSGSRALGIPELDEDVDEENRRQLFLGVGATTSGTATGAASYDESVTNENLDMAPPQYDYAAWAAEDRRRGR